jgi:[ribosomal protein S18]-alanine N-acetyltransferase
MDEPVSLPVRIEPMTVSDLGDVLNIERVSFPSPWSARAYEYELRYNEMAHYFVARLNVAASNGHQDWWVWLKQMFRPTPALMGSQLVGYDGYWLMAGEAHISTIAVDPRYRGRAIGELLLAHTIEDAVRRGSHVATLEVRVSNTSAQQLYLKYGFEKVGLRKAYYSDNN